LQEKIFVITKVIGKQNLILHLLAVLLLAIVMAFIIGQYPVQKPAGEVNSMKSNSEFKMTIVYDNNIRDPRLTNDWGFACIINTPTEKILFDTGENGNILLSNMEILGVDPKEIDLVFLSHIHSDHTGGLTDFLKKNPKVTVYYPHSFPAELKNQIVSLGAKAVVIRKPQQIASGVFSTGEMGEQIKEQSLVIKSSRGLLIITGCSHPGIIKIIKRAQEIGQAKPYLVLGGFHLKGMSAPHINKIIEAFKSSGVQQVGPAHCSGRVTRSLFEKAYGNNYIPAGAGTIVGIAENDN
jgi:7,8-dihydropterin-6-yl-methyl-4-(beta-D-ribofuranosyl)aminobenzene 5'-phosphate synthase